MVSRDLERGASAGFLFRVSFLPGGGSGAGFFFGDTVSLALALSITGAEMSGTSAAVSAVVKVCFPSWEASGASGRVLTVKAL